MNKTLRIKTDIGSDKVINVNLSQDIDFFEILSLKLSQRSLYKRFSANYGVVVGRVLANEAFGVPNVKVSVFVPLSTEDEFRSDIRNLYPYRDITDYNSDNIRYNTLPNYQVDECHRPVGTMPSKRLVLDDDTVLEVFDKYYRYTTITNKSGDYMIFGIPTGNRMLHIEADLSDIGILSQRPRDFIYKGYSVDLFESPSQFKKSTNLDSLPQIISQNTSVNIYPFWGDKEVGEINITRKDINLQYKFETTCVFMGSIMTDNSESSIGHTCVPDEKVGDASQLVPCEGTIEMIRKTTDDRVEEFVIKGNRLIDADGVFCYQIPMNLDYVGMDEKGNIVPTDNPLKGIATRTRVRFRFTLNETGDATMTRHKARYLVPNSPQLYESSNEVESPSEQPMMSSSYIFDNEECYEFGSRTPDSCFRDLYWNKVYSVKNYIPRVQKSEYENTANYLAIKGVNKLGAKKSNLIPYNKINLNFNLSYQELASFINSDDDLLWKISWFWNYLRHGYPDYSIDAINEYLLQETDSVGLDFYNDWLNGCLYFPSWYWYIRERSKRKKGESVYDSQFCECKYDDEDNKNGPLYLYNNCSLVYTNRDLIINNDPEYTSHVGLFHRLNFGSLKFLGGIIKRVRNKDNAELFYYSHGNITSTDKIKKIKNEVLTDGVKETEYVYGYVRLFATDIILLGSLVDCDVDGIPQMSYDLPSTTCNIPPMGAYKKSIDDDTETDDAGKKYSPDMSEAGDEYGDEYSSFNGMNWGYYWTKSWKWNSNEKWMDMVVNKTIQRDKMYRYRFGSGLFFGLAHFHRVEGFWSLYPYKILTNIFNISDIWREARRKVEPVLFKMPKRGLIPVTDTKSCVNLERICELGVTLDANVNIKYRVNPNSPHYEIKEYVSPMDGLITDKELIGNDARAMFASMNSNKLIGVITNPRTGYKMYKIDYYYPTNFDGRMELIAPLYTLVKSNIPSVESNVGITEDFRSLDYIDFRLGSKGIVIIDEGSTQRQYQNNGGGGTFGGSSNYNGPRRSTHNHGGGGTPAGNVTWGGDATGGESNTTYGVDTNGELNYTTEVINGTRHFYGTASNVSTYHAFPLYDNSFYFFFGLNAGSTAIDKLYKNFYAYCPQENSAPFTVSPKITSSSACEDNGKITVDLMGASMPCDIYITYGDSVFASAGTVNVQSKTFSDVPPGNYGIYVSDAVGSSVEERVTVKKYPLIVNYNVIKGISSGHTENNRCTDICVIDPDDGPQYGIVEFTSYELEGSGFTVPSLTKTGDGVYTVTGENRLKIKISPEDDGENTNETMSDCVCSCNQSIGEISGNTINIYKPGKYNVEATQLCNGSETSPNNTYYNITKSSFTITVEPDYVPQPITDDSTNENNGN